MSKVRDVVVVIGIIIIVCISIILLSITLSNFIGGSEKTYSADPHEVWKVYFIDYDENGDELSFASGAIVEWYTLKNDIYTISYLQGGVSKIVKLDKTQDFLYIEVLINYDMLK